MGDRRLEVVELLAHHYTAAERAAPWGRVEPDRREEIRSRAVDLLLEAAEEAAKLYAFDRAGERLDTGLELAVGPLERARGLETRARLALWQDDGDAAWRLAREAIDLRVSVEGGSGDRRAITRLVGLLLAIPTRWPGLMHTLPTREEAHPYLDLGLSLLEDGDSEERLGLLMTQAAWGWGFAESDMDEDHIPTYEAAGREAVALARRLGRPELVSAALDAAGASVSNTRGYGAALELQEERLLLVPRLEDPAEVADIFGTMAWLLTHVGDYRRAMEISDSAYLERSRMVGLPSVSNRTKYVFQTVALFRLGNWERFWEVHRELDEGSERDRPITYHPMRTYSIAAYLEEIAGHSAAADALIERIDRSQAHRGSVGVSGARPWIVQVLVRRGRFPEARERLAEVDPVRGLQNLDLTLEAWADLIAAEGAWAEAAAIVTQAREWAAKTGLNVLPAFADRLEGRAALAAGELDLGFDLLRRARDTFARFEAAWDRARTEIVLADALTEAGHADEAAEAAGAALATLSRLDAPTEIAQAKDLLSHMP